MQLEVPLHRCPHTAERGADPQHRQNAEPPARNGATRCVQCTGSRTWPSAGNSGMNRAMRLGSRRSCRPCCRRCCSICRCCEASSRHAPQAQCRRPAGVPRTQRHPANGMRPMRRPGPKKTPLVRGFRSFARVRSCSRSFICTRCLLAIPSDRRQTRAFFFLNAVAGCHSCNPHASRCAGDFDVTCCGAHTQQV